MWWFPQGFLSPQWLYRALERGAEVYSELGFAGSLLNPKTPVLAVTGTNGKSTVTSFCAQLLQAAGWNVFSGGNLGVPLSEAEAMTGMLWWWRSRPTRWDCRKVLYRMWRWC